MYCLDYVFFLQKDSSRKVCAVDNVNKEGGMQNQRQNQTEKSAEKISLYSSWCYIHLQLINWNLWLDAIS